MVKKDNYFTCFIFFLQFYLTSLRGKDYFAKELEPGVFGPLPWSRSKSRSKNNTRSRSRSRLGKKLGAGAGARLKKKSGAGAAIKFAGSPALVLTFKLFAARCSS